jgi:hypothetical protein
MARNSARLALAGIGLSGLCVMIIAVLAAGCAHGYRAGGRDGAVAEILPPKPPIFLDGPMAALLTIADGFSAHVVMETRSSSNRAATVSGELLGRGSKLFFAPDESTPGEKRHPGGGINFIWDVTAGSGYMLSEALQGYAPISSGVRVTNVVIGTGTENSAPEKIGGHPCEQEQVSVASSDGSATVFHIWRAMDLRGFAVRINPATNSTFLSLNFSSVRLETPSGELFQPPDGFTKYDSAEALMNELMARQQNLRRSTTDTTGKSNQAEGWEGGQGKRRSPAQMETQE